MSTASANRHAVPGTRSARANSIIQPLNPGYSIEAIDPKLKSWANLLSPNLLTMWFRAGPGCPGIILEGQRPLGLRVLPVCSQPSQFIGVITLDRCHALARKVSGL